MSKDSTSINVWVLYAASETFNFINLELIMDQVREFQTNSQTHYRCSYQQKRTANQNT